MVKKNDYVVQLVYHHVKLTIGVSKFSLMESYPSKFYPLAYHHQ